MVRVLWVGLSVALMLGMASGCTKRVPAELDEGRFDPSQEVVVTFKDGSSIKGKIGQDERVEVVEGGSTYRGMIFDLNFEEIQILDCRLIRTAGDHHGEWQRMIQARKDLGEDPRDFTFRIEEIEQVEEVKLDALRTTTRTVFWTLTGVASVFLLADRS